MTTDQMCITTSKFYAIRSRIVHSMANLVSKNGRFWAIFTMIVLKDQGDCGEGNFFLVAVGLSKECKLVLNEPRAMPWCQAVVLFEVKMSRF